MRSVPVVVYVRAIPAAGACAVRLAASPRALPGAPLVEAPRMASRFRRSPGGFSAAAGIKKE